MHKATERRNISICSNRRRLHNARYRNQSSSVEGLVFILFICFPLFVIGSIIYMIVEFIKAKNLE